MRAFQRGAVGRVVCRFCFKMALKKISRGCAPDPLTPGQVRGVPEGCRRAYVWARTAVELHGCCANAAPERVSLAEALLNQHVDGVARAGSAGTKSGSSARSLVLLTMLAPVMENRTVRAFGDQLGLDDEANSQIADGYATGSSARRGVAVGDLPTSSVSPVQLIPPRSGFCLLRRRPL